MEVLSSGLKKRVARYVITIKRKSMSWQKGSLCFQSQQSSPVFQAISFTRTKENGRLFGRGRPSIFRMEVLVSTVVLFGLSEKNIKKKGFNIVKIHTNTVMRHHNQKKANLMDHVIFGVQGWDTGFRSLRPVLGLKSFGISNVEHNISQKFRFRPISTSAISTSANFVWPL